MEPWPSLPSRKGFSLTEVLVGVAALAIVASIAVSAMVGVHSGTRASKLNSDVTTINAAIKAYIASGGDLSGAKTADQVLGRLKATASAERARRLTGLSSSVIDERLACRMQSEQEAKDSSPRARWNPTEMQFVIESSGAPGIKEFYFSAEALAASDNVETAQEDKDERAGKMLFSKESGWIWDYQDNAPDVIPGPTVVQLGTPSPPPPYVPPVPAAAASAPSPSTSPIPLAEPVFSPLGGIFPMDGFPLSVTLTNPNPAGVSKIAYSLDAASWHDYSGPLSIPADTTVLATAIALDPAWIHSATVSESYQSERVTLAAPVISPSRKKFNFSATNNILVTLDNPNPAGVSITRYRVNGSLWQDYSAPFVLENTIYAAAGATIEAQAVPDGSPLYLPSPISQEAIGRQSIVLNGTTSGAFKNPTGPAGMVSNLNAGGSNSRFEWGDATGASNLSESWMEYSGTSFADIQDSARFGIGELTYYNGTILADSGATTVDLTITLTVDVNGQVFHPFFDFTFELVNSQNVAGDEWGSADYVKIVDPRSSRTLVFNDYEFEFRVEFGSSTSNGFGAFDEFHVLENRSASVDVFGTFINLGLVTDNTNSLEGGNTIAVDDGTGTASDPLFQKLGYVDAEEHVDTLGDTASELVRHADDSLHLAEDGLDMALAGSKDIARKLTDRNYPDAGKLTANAHAGAAAAELAAQEAEQAASAAHDAAVAAKLAASSDPNLEEDAIKIVEAAAAAQAKAEEARLAADEAAAALATVTAETNNFQQRVVSEIADDEEHEDEDGYIAGYVEFLKSIARADRDNAKSSRDAAKSAEEDASSSAVRALDKLEEGKLTEARREVIKSANASALSELAAQSAEASSTSADSAASEANAIAADYSSTAQDAADAVNYATEASGFATEARNYADSAAFAASQAASLPFP